MRWLLSWRSPVASLSAVIGDRGRVGHRACNATREAPGACRAAVGLFVRQADTPGLDSLYPRQVVSRAGPWERSPVVSLSCAARAASIACTVGEGRAC
jgi:hypothetical protein